jgi:hypothetical protein
MTALVIVQTLVIVVLAVLVAGLLRSHAEILRALHDLGAGLDDDSAARRAQRDRRRDDLARARNVADQRRNGGTAAAGNSLAPGVPGPGFLTGDPVFDLVGKAPHGASLAVAVAGTGRRTLIAFLTSGCSTCQAFWDELRSPRLSLPPEVDRLVIVTHSQDQESPALIGRLAPPAASGVTVVMADEPWVTYRVPATPYFVLADGTSDTIVGEGAAKGWPQLLGLLGRAVADSEPMIDLASPESDPARPARPELDAADAGPGRRRDRADAALARAGIEPGHPSLYGPGAAAPPEPGSA